MLLQFLNLFFLSLIIVTKSFAFTINDFEIRDLESTSGYFTEEAKAWSITNKGSSSANSTTCNGTFLLGGYQVGGASTIYQRTYTSLPSHTAISFSISVWVLDLSPLTLDLGNLYKLYFDDVLVGTLYSSTLRGIATKDYCGSGLLMDYPSIATTGQISHSSSSVTLKIQAVIPSGSVTFGFRDVNLLFLNSTSAVTNTVCGYSSIALVENTCLCGENQYNTALFLCGSCTPGCSSCTGNSASDCMACDSGYSFNGEECEACPSGCTQCSGLNPSKCLSCDLNAYLYMNGSCLGSCEAPFVLKMNGDNKLCNLPCEHGEFYYLNDTNCYDTCEAPLVTGSLEAGAILTCDLPCKNGEFLYWNGSCLGECETPFVISKQNGVDVCVLPCETDEFYYLNDTICRETCEDPLVSGSFEEDLLTCELPCQSNEYLYWNGTCQTSCDDPLIRGIDNGIEICNLPCDDPSDYYYFNETCLSICDPPFQSAVDGDLKICYLPCLAEEFLYWNMTCHSSCDPPLIPSVQNGIDICELPCGISEFYYLNNETCQEECSFPFEERALGDLKLCESPCEASEYLYWNGSCRDTCPVSRQKDLGSDTMYCESYCEGFEYWNQSCLTSCDYPFVERTDGELLKYCDLPCNADVNFLHQEGSCLSYCNPPFETEYITSYLSLCNSPCSSPDDYYFLGNSTCISNCDPPLISASNGLLKTCKANGIVTSTAPENITKSQMATAIQTLSHVTTSMATIANLINFGDASSLLVLVLSDVLNYIQYIDISYPAEVEELFGTDADILSFGLNLRYDLPSAIREQIPERPIPAVFQRRGLHSSFLLNDWSALFFMLISIGAVIGYYPLEWIANKTRISFLNRQVKRLENVIKWNLFLIFFVTNYAEIVLYGTLEFFSFKPRSPLAIISFLVCVIMILLGLNFLWKMVRIPLEIFFTKKYSEIEVSVIEKKWEAFEMFYQPYKNNSFWSLSFLLISTLRIILCYIIIVSLYHYSVLQTVLLTMLSLLSLIYAIVSRPMKEIMGVIEAILFEFIVLGVNICVVILAIIGKESDSRERVGAVIVFANMTVRILSALFVLFSLFTNLLVFYMNWRKARRAKEGGMVAEEEDEKILGLSLRRILSLKFKHGKRLKTQPAETLTNQLSLRRMLSLLYKHPKGSSLQSPKLRRKTTFESMKISLRRLLSLAFKPRKVAPEPIRTIKTVKEKTQQQNSGRGSITPRLSVRRNPSNKPLYVVTDLVGASDHEKAMTPESNYESASDTQTTLDEKRLLTGSPVFDGRSSNSSLLRMPLHTILKFSESETAGSLSRLSPLKEEKLDFGIIELDEGGSPLEKYYKRRQPRSLRSGGSTPDSLRNNNTSLISLGSPTNEVLSRQSLMRRSSRNGGNSPSVDSEIRVVSLAEVRVWSGSPKKRDSKNSRGSILETIPEKEP